MTVTSAEGVSTDVALSENDAMIVRGISAGQAVPYRYFSKNMRVEMPPLNELVAQERFSQKSTFYSCQSANTLSKDYFELNPPTVLDPGHTTNSFSANEMIQLAIAVGLEVTLESYGLLEDLLLRAGGIGSVGDC